MIENLAVGKDHNLTDKMLAPVIPITQSVNKNESAIKKFPKEKGNQELPCFYTAAIFKPRKHDPL